MNRWPDWWNQAERDLAHARVALDAGNFEWAAFAAQQAAEKAVKSMVIGSGGEPWGHSVTALLQALPGDVDLRLLDAGRRLDKHYIPARYPNGLPAGHPGGYYTRGEAETAIDDANTLLEFVRSHLPRP
ncbi:MAG TPA: HEPN domain-containing protein [Thermoanaerobaculia bacterium]|nr:HEPN domain-containing protein [Thermoanaerobaculia bacterium]